MDVCTRFSTSSRIACSFCGEIRAARELSRGTEPGKTRWTLVSCDRESDPARFASNRSVSRAATCAYRITRLIIDRHWTPAASQHCTSGSYSICAATALTAIVPISPWQLPATILNRGLHGCRGLARFTTRPYRALVPYATSVKRQPAREQ